jgi:hypothetical protein
MQHSGRVSGIFESARVACALGILLGGATGLALSILTVYGYVGAFDGPAGHAFREVSKHHFIKDLALFASFVGTETAFVEGKEYVERWVGGLLLGGFVGFMLMLLTAQDSKIAFILRLTLFFAGGLGFIAGAVVFALTIVYRLLRVIIGMLR